MKHLPLLFVFVVALAASSGRAEIRRDVEYGTAAGVALRLDANIPDGDGPFPVAILVHGGGWSGGDKAGSDKPGNGADITPWFAPLTESKFTWFSINYRLAPEHRWPACIDDVVTAIRWVKAHAAEFKGDPARIALFGHSAGGQLVCLAALDAADDLRVQSVVGFAPVTDFEQDLAARGGLSTSLQQLHGRPQAVTPEALALLRETSPLNHVKAGAPHFLLVHGSADRTVPLAQSLAFQAKLRAHGSTCDLLEVKDAGHGLLALAKADPEIMAKAIEWTRKALMTTTGGTTVAADGSGDFRSVQEAINASPQNSTAAHPWTIRVKPGVYKERLYIQREKRFLRLIGEDAATTIVSFDLHANVPGPDGKPIGTFRTPSTQVDADDFTAENLTFANSAGPVGQALAIRVDGDRHVYRRCRFEGWQDTILVNRGRHYFEECVIAGHVDFIFGAGTDWFERCEIRCLRDGYITAASTPAEASFGYVFNRCRVVGATPEVRTYLGRPWRPFAATLFLDCELGAVVRPEGWHNWGKPERERTTRYAEFGSTGEGASAGARVAWAKTPSAEEAAAVTVPRVLAGNDGWNPLSVP
ncbi:MAG: pectinesterase family protein [Opitutaceae bacterium]